MNKILFEIDLLYSFRCFLLQMTTNDQAKSSLLLFPNQSIQFLADFNQCPHLSDEAIRYLTGEATGIVRFLLQVNRTILISLASKRIRFFLLFRMR